MLVGPGRAGIDGLDGRWSMSAITLGELHAGVLMASGAGVRAARLRRLQAVSSALPTLGIDARVAMRFGELRAASGHRASNDLWIAATALAHDLTLVTRDREQAALPIVRCELVTG